MYKISFLAAASVFTFNIYAVAGTTPITSSKTTPKATTPTAPKMIPGCVVNPVAELTIFSAGKKMGEIDVQLDTAKAPISVANFVQYVNSGFYENKIFHRVIPGFMIQGGGFDEKLNQADTKASIKNEANNGLVNDKYTIAMARTNDPDSATAQFFINVNDNPPLNYSPSNPGYAVFGKVIKGREVVDKIALTPTKTVNMYENVPVTAVIIKSAKMRPCK
ncbi:MAG TPA: peptidylprolyl isomerase [Aquella sp.]|nr:peptidylprolyl isomerase [Aquella sp.]